MVAQHRRRSPYRLLNTRANRLVPSQLSIAVEQQRCLKPPRRRSLRLLQLFQVFNQPLRLLVPYPAGSHKKVQGYRSSPCILEWLLHTAGHCTKRARAVGGYPKSQQDSIQRSPKGHRNRKLPCRDQLSQFRVRIWLSDKSWLFLPENRYNRCAGSELSEENLQF
jgi:hypothetical protein